MIISYIDLHLLSADATSPPMSPFSVNSLERAPSNHHHIIVIKQFTFLRSLYTGHGHRETSFDLSTATITSSTVDNAATDNTPITTAKTSNDSYLDIDLGRSIEKELHKLDQSKDNNNKETNYVPSLTLSADNVYPTANNSTATNTGTAVSGQRRPSINNNDIGKGREPSMSIVSRSFEGRRPSIGSPVGFSIGTTSLITTTMGSANEILIRPRILSTETEQSDV